MLKILKFYALVVITSIKADLDPSSIDFSLIPNEISQWILEQAHLKNERRNLQTGSGFSPDDYQRLSTGETYEEIDFDQPPAGPPYYFKITDPFLQVSPKKVQTKRADFAFTFKLKRDLNYGKPQGSKALININFRKYFQELAKINETAPRGLGIHAGFDAELFQFNRDNNQSQENCYPQSWVSNDDCILLGTAPAEPIDYDYAVQVRSIVNYTLQLEILTDSDFYAFMDKNSTIKFYTWKSFNKNESDYVNQTDENGNIIFDDGNRWVEGRDGEWVEGNCYSDEWCDPSLNSTKGYMNAEENWTPLNSSNLSQSRNQSWIIEFPDEQVYEVRNLLMKRSPEYPLQPWESFQMQFWYDEATGWRWYPEQDYLVPSRLEYTSQAYYDKNSIEHEYEIPLDSFDARKLRFFYNIDIELKYGPEFNETDGSKLWTDEMYNQTERIITRFDVMLSRAKKYYWKDIALVIKNVPTTPYEMKSSPIYILVTTQKENEFGQILSMQDLLGWTQVDFSTQRQTTVALGAILDRDYYPEFNPLNFVKGEKINVLKVWVQTATEVKHGAYATFKIPQEIMINITQPDKFTLEGTQNWVNNKTKFNCTALQGLSHTMECELQSLYCTRQYGEELQWTNLRNYIASSARPQYTEYNYETIVNPETGRETFRPFFLRYCYRSKADWFQQCQGGTLLEQDYQMDDQPTPCKPIETDIDLWPAPDEDTYNIVHITDAFAWWEDFPDGTQKIFVPFQGRENITDTFYPPNYYSFKIYNVFSREAPTEMLSPQTIQMTLFAAGGQIYEVSDPFNLRNTINFEKSKKFYADYEGKNDTVTYAQCDMHKGCGQLVNGTSQKQTEALKDFYEKTQGKYWQFQYNWNVGDPCMELWYGVTCNIEHQVIGLHFFENHMNGYINKDTFKDLKYLKFISIFNDGREFEQEPNYHMNSIWFFDTEMFEGMTELEEINMTNLGMSGYIGNDFVNLKNLKYVDLTGNNLTGSLPNIDAWKDMKNLRMLQLGENNFTGKTPDIWEDPSCFVNLEYMSINNNSFGDVMHPMPILYGAQNLEAIDLSDNNFNGPYPMEYLSNQTFQKLLYVAANFNQNVTVPPFCVRQAFCYKKQILYGRNANDMNFLEFEIIDVINKSYDVFEMYKVDL